MIGYSDNDRELKLKEYAYAVELFLIHLPRMTDLYFYLLDGATDIARLYKELNTASIEEFEQH